MKKLPTLEDVKRRVDVVNGCWVWKRFKNRDGYADWSIGDRICRTRIAHRVVYFLANGNLPVWPMVLDHICKNKACVNPDHLRVLHHTENSLDGIHSPTHCPYGHSRWRERPSPAGRECLDCRNTWKKRYRARRKAGLVTPRAGQSISGK